MFYGPYMCMDMCMCMCMCMHMCTMHMCMFGPSRPVPRADEARKNSRFLLFFLSLSLSCVSWLYTEVSDRAMLQSIHLII